MHDVIIIGAGPAGLSTAFWCDELGLDTLVLEQAERDRRPTSSRLQSDRKLSRTKARNGEELLELFAADVDGAEFDLWTQTCISVSGFESEACFVSEWRRSCSRSRL